MKSTAFRAPMHLTMKSFCRMELTSTEISQASYWTGALRSAFERHSHHDVTRNRNWQMLQFIWAVRCVICLSLRTDTEETIDGIAFLVSRFRFLTLLSPVIQSV
jgi:hypothetical protein